MRGAIILGLVVGVAAVAAPHALPSNKITSGATGVSLKITKDSKTAIVAYQAHGRTWIVSASGAINARPPDPNTPQFEFKLNYNAAATPGYCGKYDGPRLHWVVAACKAPDGSYWAVQSWQRPLRNAGVATDPKRAEPELRISHWKGPLEVFTVKQDWAYAGRYDHLYGSLTYLGKPMYGFKTDHFGQPLDKYGNLVYVDTYNSAYGKGWKRDNSFVTHKPSGIFCALFSPRGGRPAGTGAKYRATVVGPGALPDVYWSARRKPFDPAADAKANEEQRLHYTDKLCHAN